LQPTTYSLLVLSNRRFDHALRSGFIGEGRDFAQVGFTLQSRQQLFIRFADVLVQYVAALGFVFV